MKARIVVGLVEIRVEDLQLSKRQLIDLLREAAGVAALLGSTSLTEETEPKAPLGFTAHLELDPQRNDEPDLSEWFEESP